MTDDELLEAIESAYDAEERMELLVLPAQRGLRNAGLEIPMQERRKQAEERGTLT